MKIVNGVQIGAPLVRPAVREPLGMFYEIQEGRYEIHLDEIDMSIFKNPHDCSTGEDIAGSYVFKDKRVRIPAMTRYIVVPAVFIPERREKYAVAVFPVIIEFINYEKTYEYKDFSRKRGLWFC